MYTGGRVSNDTDTFVEFATLNPNREASARTPRNPPTPRGPGGRDAPILLLPCPTESPAPHVADKGTVLAKRAGKGGAAHFVVLGRLAPQWCTNAAFGQPQEDPKRLQGGPEERLEPDWVGRTPREGKGVWPLLALAEPPWRGGGGHRA